MPGRLGCSLSGNPLSVSAACRRGSSRFAFRHHRQQPGSPCRGYPYGYYNSYGCYERIWTQWGWRLTYVCGGYY
jgi:hypothetical protein